MVFAADFETTNDKEDCRVWSWGISNIDFDDSFMWGKDIESFIDFMKEQENATFYFHNLDFDGAFIIDKLFRQFYEYCSDSKKLYNRSFSTLISNVGKFYSMKIKFDNENIVTIKDSLKILPSSVDRIAKDFKMEISKLSIDYNKYREIGYEPTQEEIEYLKHDVMIMSYALNFMYNKNMKNLTAGSNALNEYKKMTGKSKYKQLFPELDKSIDDFLRFAYKGGFTYCDPRTQGKIIENFNVFDVNSLYPSVMYYKPLPCGYPKYYKGKYRKNEKYPLFVQKIRCQFTLKKNYIPTIQIKRGMFKENEYLKDSGDEYPVLTLSNVDLELFHKHYHVYNIEYIDGYMFKESKSLFKDYIDKWGGEKEKATIEGNGALRTLSKLMLNSLYGKFGKNPKVISKHPYFDNDEDMVKFETGKPEIKKTNYLPVALFVTSWARYVTISAAQNNYDNFMYADTDSLHLKGAIPDNLEIHSTKLGAWAHESEVIKGKFLAQKTYVEYEREPGTDGEFRKKVTCAGMPYRCHEHVTLENFKFGTKYKGKIQKKRVKGGIVLIDTEFTLKQR